MTEAAQEGRRKRKVKRYGGMGKYKRNGREGRKGRRNRELRRNGKRKGQVKWQSVESKGMQRPSWRRETG